MTDFDDTKNQENKDNRGLMLSHSFLPPEVLLRIFSHLPADNVQTRQFLCTLQSVNHAWQQLLRNPLLWYTHVKFHFPYLIDENSNQTQDYYQTFVKEYQRYQDKLLYNVTLRYPVAEFAYKTIGMADNQFFTFSSPLSIDQILFALRAHKTFPSLKEFEAIADNENTVIQTAIIKKLKIIAAANGYVNENDMPLNETEIKEACDIALNNSYQQIAEYLSQKQKESTLCIPFLIAASKGDLSEIKRYLESESEEKSNDKNSDEKITLIDIMLAFQNAYDNGHTDCVKYFLTSENILTKEQKIVFVQTIFSISSKKGDLESLKVFSKYLFSFINGIEFYASVQAALLSAIEFGHLNYAEYLSNAISARFFRTFALKTFFAIILYNHLDFAKLFWKKFGQAIIKEVDSVPNNILEQAIEIAAKRNDLESVKFLLQVCTENLHSTAILHFNILENLISELNKAPDKFTSIINIISQSYPFKNEYEELAEQEPHSEKVEDLSTSESIKNTFTKAYDKLNRKAQSSSHSSSSSSSSSSANNKSDTSKKENLRCTLM